VQRIDLHKARDEKLLLSFCHYYHTPTLATMGSWPPWGHCLTLHFTLKTLHSHAHQLHLDFEKRLLPITARGNARQPICQDDADRRQFLQLLAREFLQQRRTY
jgi:hypothetical protein